MWGGYDWYSPAGDAMLRGNGMNAWFGWPTRRSWSRSAINGCTRPTCRLRRRSQEISSCRRSQDVPCMPLGLYYQPVAYRNDLTDMMKGLILFTGVRRA